MVKLVKTLAFHAGDVGFESRRGHHTPLKPVQQVLGVHRIDWRSFPLLRHPKTNLLHRLAGSPLQLVTTRKVGNKRCDLLQSSGAQALKLAESTVSLVRVTFMRLPNILYGSVAKLVIASACHAEDHGFKSRRSRHMQRYRSGHNGAVLKTVRRQLHGSSNLSRCARCVGEQMCTETQ